MHAQKETEFLRLKRSRLGIDDFDSLKVIGRGAFGEVSTILSVLGVSHKNKSFRLSHYQSKFFTRR